MKALVLTAGLAALLATGSSRAAAQPAGREAPEMLRDVLVSGRTAPESLTVGDRVTLEVRVQAPAGWEVRFPEGLEAGGPIEFVDLKVERQKGKGRAAAGPRREWVARYTLAVFAVGDLVLPPWPVEVRSESLWAVASTDSLRLRVQSVLDDSLAAAGLRDLKPQASLPLSPWPWIVAAGMALVAAAALVWWLRRRRRPRAPVVPIQHARPAHDVALEALRRLESEHLPVDGKFVLYHVRLSEILRRYLEDGFGVAALEETTEEILFDLQRHGFDRTTLAQVRDLCAESDLIKFAKHEPTVEDCMRSLERVRDFVRATAARAALVAS